MKWLSVLLACLGAVTGIVAAYYWYRSSQVSINPVWLTESGDPHASQSGWLAATMGAFSESARLNKIAASWTAAAVVLNMLSYL
jgi:hypothetical protein